MVAGFYLFFDAGSQTNNFRSDQGFCKLTKSSFTHKMVLRLDGKNSFSTGFCKIEGILNALIIAGFLITNLPFV
jgi:hypothetical protein